MSKGPKEEESHMSGTGFPNSPTFKPIFDELREEWKKEGETKGKREIAFAMLRKEYPDEDILDITGLTKGELQELNKNVILEQQAGSREMQGVSRAFESLSQNMIE
ncbi:hypothetical protein [Lentibacillus jeotgali]|uniref:hypothetical protein n=1 Tax=Lentibacillus jeotgali TaxID=558169 RepID=UPI0002626C59|nr:hypothetical protein [Lentibacillus jeotgali]